MVAPVVAAAALSAGSSLLGGLFNRNAQKKANAANRPVNQVREWEAAGINPLYGISSGGYIPHQAMTLGDSFASAGARIARGLELKHEDELRETELEQENERLRGEIVKLAEAPLPGYLPQYRGLLPLPGLEEHHETALEGGSGDRQAPVLGAGGEGLPADPDSGSLRPTGSLEDGDLTVTNPAIRYKRTWVHPRWVDTEATETRYGEFLAEVTGVGTFVADNWYNDRMHRIASRHGEAIAERVHSEFAKGDGRTLSEIEEEILPLPPRQNGPPRRNSRTSKKRIIDGNRRHGRNAPLN